MNGPFRTKPVRSRRLPLVSGWRGFAAYGVLSAFLMGFALAVDPSFFVVMAGMLGAHWLSILLVFGSRFRAIEFEDDILTLSQWLRQPIHLHREEVVLRRHGGRVSLDIHDRIFIGLHSMGKERADELLKALSDFLGYEGETERAALQIAGDQGELGRVVVFDLATDGRDTFLRAFLGAAALWLVGVAFASHNGFAMPLCFAALLGGVAIWSYLSTPQKLVLHQKGAVISYRSGGHRKIPRTELVVRRDHEKGATVIGGTSIQDRVLAGPESGPRLLAALSDLCGYDVTDPAGETSRLLREVDLSA